MDRHRWANLLFLSGLASVPGCDDDEGGGSPTSSATASATATAGNGETGSDTMSGTDGDGTSAGGSTTSNDPTDTPTSGGPSGDFPVCTEFATQSANCEEDDYDAALQYCNELLASLNEYYSADCAMAYEELLACAAGVDCAEFNGDEIPPACESASQAVGEACEFVVGESSTGAGSGGDTDSGTGG